MTRILIVGLGGTIASTNQGNIDNAPVTPSLGAEELLLSIGSIPPDVDAECRTIFIKPSGDLTLEDVRLVANAVKDAIKSGIEGVIITQGTDCLEETSFALDLFLGQLSIPVIVVGAMKNPSLLLSDGPNNLMSAILAISSQQLSNVGVVVLMNDKIIPARYVVKSHTSDVGSFQSAVGCVIGAVSEGRVSRYCTLSPYPFPAFSTSHRIDSKVGVYLASMEDDMSVIPVFGELGFDGLILAGLGGGHVPARAIPSLVRARQSFPIVISSRVPFGSTLSSTYAFPGSEYDLRNRGFRFTGELSTAKAWVALKLCLTESGGGLNMFDTIRESISAD